MPQPINPRQRQFIQGLTGDPNAMTVPAQSQGFHQTPQEQDDQSDLINKLLMQRALQQQQAAQTPPESRQFPQIQQSLNPDEDERQLRRGQLEKSGTAEGSYGP